MFELKYLTINKTCHCGQHYCAIPEKNVEFYEDEGRVVGLCWGCVNPKCENTLALSEERLVLAIKDLASYVSVK